VDKETPEPASRKRSAVLGWTAFPHDLEVALEAIGFCR
jgi:hypothetical protein